MIEAPTTCFFTGILNDETAQLVMQDFFPSIASDIKQLTLLSADFQTDIEALNSLDDATKRIKSIVFDEISLSEKFNPLFIPRSLDAVDDVLDASAKSDNLKFVEFNGNPFIVKQVELKRDDEKVGVFLAQHHPFELPAYSEIISSYEQFLPN